MFACAGDGSGGNLAAALTVRAIAHGLRVPDKLVLAYPILNLSASPTPSRTLFMMDAILPMNMLLQVACARASERAGWLVREGGREGGSEGAREGNDRLREEGGCRQKAEQLR